MSQPDISEDQYLELCKDWFPTQSQAALKTAYRIRHILSGELNQENVEFVLNGGLKKVKIFEIYFAKQADLERFDRNQKPLDWTLRDHVVERHKMLREAIGKTRIDPENFQGEFGHEECQAVLDFFLANAAKANAVFGLLIDAKRPPKCATTFLMKLLRRLGLSLGKRKSHGIIKRFIDPVSFATMQGHLRNRLASGQNFLLQDERP